MPTRLLLAIAEFYLMEKLTSENADERTILGVGVHFTPHGKFVKYCFFDVFTAPRQTEPFLSSPEQVRCGKPTKAGRIFTFRCESFRYNTIGVPGPATVNRLFFRKTFTVTGAVTIKRPTQST